MVEATDAKLTRGVRWALMIGGAVFAAVLVGGLAIRWAKSREVKNWTLDTQVPTVALLSVDRNATPQSLVLPGILRAYYSAQIYSRVPGYVRYWRRDIGAAVRKDELLANIDTPELDQQLSQARADLDTARSAKALSDVTARRWNALAPLDAVSKQAAQEKSAEASAKASGVEAAAANLRRLEALKEFGRIVAPFDGIVTARNVDVGALVSGGSVSGAEPMFAVSDVHRLRLYVNVPQSYSAQITRGLKGVLTVPEYPGRSFDASLDSTSKAINSESGTLLVELQVDNRDGALLPGSYAQVRLTLPPGRDRLVVPASALLFRAAGLQVATVNSALRVVMKRVTIARDLGARVEIESGLEPQDRIIDNPPDSLAAGDPVRLAGREAAGTDQNGAAHVDAR